MSMEISAWNALYNAQYAEQDQRPFSRETLHRIGRFARPYGRAIAWFLAASCLTALLAVATPLLAGRVIDAITDQAEARTLAMLAVIIAGIALAEAGLGLLSRWLSSRVGEGLIYDLRTAVFDHVQKLPLAFFARTRTGALVSRLNNDVIGAQRAFSDTLSGVVSNFVMVMLTIAVMLQLSWHITLITLILLPVFIVPARRMGSRLARLSRESSNLNAAMSSRMTERFSAPGATLVKLFGRPTTESAQFAARADEVRNIGVRTAMLQMTFITALTLVSALALAVVYGVGGVLALQGTLAAGTIVSLALLLTRLYAPLTELAGARVEIMGAMVSFQRVFEVLDLEPLIADRPDARTLPLGKLSLEFDRVDFGYPSADKVSLASLEEVAALETSGGEQVLHEVTMIAEPGEMIALVGSSGSGKSTIAQLAARLYDVDSGAVRIGGFDVRDLRADSLQQAVGLVTQDGHLFHDTIAENLRLAYPEASEEQMYSALRTARLGKLIEELPQGLDTFVGERGYRLSGGERQRLTIARILLAQPPVVILDEATAHLDSTSEAEVQEALTAALDGRTALVIAHRLSTVRRANKIFVLEGGRIVERGTHQHLLAMQGRYAELHRVQFGEENTLTASTFS